MEMNMVYSELENNYEKYDHNRRTIDGRNVGCSKCVGYCNYDGHRGYLTSKERNKHMCLGKGCNYYIPKTKGETFSTLLNLDDVRTYFVNPQECLDKAKKAIEDFEGMAITRMDTDKNGHYQFSYVTISNSYDIKSIAKSLAENFGVEVTLKKIECSYEHAVKVIFNIDVA